MCTLLAHPLSHLARLLSAFLVHVRPSTTKITLSSVVRSARIACPLALPARSLCPPAHFARLLGLPARSLTILLGCPRSLFNAWLKSRVTASVLSTQSCLGPSICLYYRCSVSHPVACWPPRSLARRFLHTHYVACPSPCRRPACLRQSAYPRRITCPYVPAAHDALSYRESLACPPTSPACLHTCPPLFLRPDLSRSPARRCLAY